MFGGAFRSGNPSLCRSGPAQEIQSHRVGASGILAWGQLLISLLLKTISVTAFSNEVNNLFNY